MLRFSLNPKVKMSLKFLQVIQFAEAGAYSPLTHNSSGKINRSGSLNSAKRQRTTFPIRNDTISLSFSPLFLAGNIM
jgi:hypothetical protein